MKIKRVGLYARVSTMHGQDPNVHPMRPRLNKGSQSFDLTSLAIGLRWG
jgi:hypothetical protein